jgi:polycomb-like protein 2
VFVCALCNDGEEFVRRLELAWVDLVHVALYNLTVIYAKKYYDLDTMIVPYINERWEEWQLPPRVRIILISFST